MSAETDYRKYLKKPPTPLMEHIEEWIRDKAGIDPSKEFKTKADAFAMGVYLTVHLRMTHQASPENQDRLEKNRLLAQEAEAERQDRREERKAVGAKPRGRIPKAKAATEPEAVAEEKPAPKRRGRPKKVEQVEPATKPAKPRGRPRTKAAATEVIPDVPAAEPAEPPKRRGRPRKAATPAAEVPAATETPSNVTQLPTERTATRRRRPVRRGEAAF